MFRVSTTLLRRVLSFGLIVTLTAPLTPPAVQAEALPLPTAELALPASGQLGEPVTFTVTLSNAAAGTTGYGPYVDLFLPPGADGDDGLEFTAASVVGIALTPYGDRLVCTAVEQFTHPLTGLQAPCNEGETVLVLKLPFLTQTAAQAPLVISVTAGVSPAADAGFALTVRAGAGFFLGADAENNPLVDAPIVQAVADSASYTPIIWRLTKAYTDGFEDETATGPNFPRRYTLAIDVSSGQPLTELRLRDELPASMQFVGIVSVTTADISTTYTVISAPLTTEPGGTLLIEFDRVRGNSSGGDVVVVIEYYIARLDTGNAEVLSHVTGNDVDVVNTFSASAVWDPSGPGDATRSIEYSGVDVGNRHTLHQRSIALVKTVTPLGGTIVAPNQQVRYDLTFDVSDYFAFSDVVLEDLLPDGLRFDDSVTPTMTCRMRNTTVGPLSFSGATMTVFDNWTDVNGAASPNPGEPASSHDIDPAVNNGTSTVQFRVSELLIANGGDGKLIGGGIPPGGTGAGALPDLPPLYAGGTTCDISFTARIMDRYTDDYPSGDYSVDQNDTLVAPATVGGTLLNVTDLSPTAYDESDGSSATFSISGAVTEKTVYAINGDTSCAPGDCSGGTNTVIAPGDEVTFRLKMELTTSDIEELRIADVLPPYFTLSPTAQAVSRISSIAMITGTVPPAVGTARLGPDDDFFAESGITPTISNDVDAGVIMFDYGSYDDPDDTPNVIDLLLTVTVDFLPITDRLMAYNNFAQYEGSTNSGDHRTDVGETFLLLAPELSLRKGVIAVDASSPSLNTFAYPSGFSVNEAAPCATRLGSGTTSRFTANQLTDATLNADAVDLDAGDRVTYGLLIQNTGSAPNGAFDVTLRDEQVAGLSFVDGSICVHRIDSNSVLSYTLIGGGLFDANGGIRINDFSEPNPEVGAINAGRDFETGAPLTAGQGLLLVSYQVTVDADAGNGVEMVSEATLFHYASRQDGPDFSLIDLTDNVKVKTGIPVMSFDLLATSEDHTDAADLAIGEIARVRAAALLPEGIHSSAMLLVDLPNGMTFIDDNTARLALVSNGSGITSSSFPTASLTISGTDVTTATAAAADVTFVLPDNAVSRTSSGNNDTYVGGNDVYFKFGTLTNSDRDDDDEFVVVDFNVLMNNSTSAANRFGNSLQPAVDIYVGGSQVNGDAGTVNLQVVEPQISLSYEITPLSGEAGDTVTYTLTLDNDEGSTSATAYDLLLSSQLASTLISPTLVSTPTVSAGVQLLSRTLTVTATQLAPGQQLKVVLQAVLGETVQAGLPVTGTIDAEWTSLPGAAGTQSNATGSRVGGASGDADGERDASSTVTDYQASADNELTINGADLDLALGVSSDTATSGNSLTIGEIVTATIALHLPGGTTPDLRVTTFIPAGVSYLTGTQALITGTYNGAALSPTLTTTGGSGADLRLDFGTLLLPADSDAANNTFTVTLQLQVLNIAGNSGLSALPPGVQAAPTTRVISAALQSATLPPVTSESQTLSLVEPQLAAALAFSDAIFDPGDNVTVTLTLTNTGSSSAYDLTITNLLTDTVLSNATELFTPPGFSFARANATPSSGLTTLTYSGTSLAAGSSVTMTYRVTLPVNLSAGRRITNTAVVQQYSSLAGSVGGERTAAPLTTTALLSISAVNLSLSKTDGLTTTVPDSTLVYTLTAANIGNLDTAGVVVTETVPANTSFAAADSSAGWSCADGSAAGTVCRYEIGTLNIADEQELTFAVTVSPTIPAGITALTNTATIADNGALGADDVAADNTATDVNALAAAPDIELYISDNAAVPLPGGVISYTISYSNTGTQDARGTVVRATVPANTTYRARGSTGGWSCADGAVGGRPCRMTIGNLAAGASGSVVLVAVVNYPFPSGVISVEHRATIADDGANGTDPTPDNNNALAISELSPTAITLSAFSVVPDRDGTTVRWTTGSEVDTFGFLIYRSSELRRSTAVLVTAQPVAARGMFGGGASYEVRDTGAVAGEDVHYWLVEIERNGRRTEYGPLLLAAPPPLLPQQFIPFVLR